MQIIKETQSGDAIAKHQPLQHSLQSSIQTFTDTILMEYFEDKKSEYIARLYCYEVVNIDSDNAWWMWFPTLSITQKIIPYDRDTGHGRIHWRRLPNTMTLIAEMYN